MARTGAHANFAAVVSAAAFAVLSAAGAWAGSGSFEALDDKDSKMLHFLGYTRGEDGKPVSGVRVTISIVKGEVTEMSDGNGLFFFDSSDPTYDPHSIDFSCAKAGYKDAAGGKERYSGDNAPVMVTCLMQRQ